MDKKIMRVNAMGDTCPIPIVKAKNAIKELAGSGEVEVLVDNEIAVQNLTKMANQKGYGVKAQKLGEQEYQVLLTIDEPKDDAPETAKPDVQEIVKPEEDVQMSTQPVDSGSTCETLVKNNTVIAISSSKMGEGNEELGSVLMKGFIYALTQQEILPSVILCYNGGAALTCEESPALEDFKMLEAQGVEILTCGTCLNYYGLTDRLKVGSATNMYTIVEKLSQADKVIKP